MAKRGRPVFKKTAQQSKIVEELVSCGESKESISRALKIDAETLNKHFAHELAQGISTRRREVISLLFREARKGNVTAIKKLEEMTKLTGAQSAFDASAAETPRKLGKKEAAALSAETAGLSTEWGADLKAPATAESNKTLN